MNLAVLKLIKKVYFLTSKVVEYKPRETICPICEFLSIVEKSSVKVLKSSRDGIRYCECTKCGSHFRAYREGSSKKIEKVQLNCTNSRKSVKTKSKAGKTDDNKLGRTGTTGSKQRNRSNSKRSTKLSD